jgi:hypothetical protein
MFETMGPYGGPDPADLPGPAADVPFDDTVRFDDDAAPPDEADVSAWVDEELDAAAVEAACAFEDQLAAAAFVELDADATLEQMASSRSAERRVQAEQLATAAHWADLNAVLQAPCRVPGGERLVRVGGEGTPEIAEFCVAELGVVMQTTDTTAAALVADALDLRHRLPHLWTRVQAGQVEVWRARQVASRTRKLTQAAVARVDAQIGNTVGRVTGRRLAHLVSKAILEADPPKARSDAEAAAAEAGVHYRPDDVEHGYGSMFIRAAAGDLDDFNKALDVISWAMKVLGDPRPADQRRATAVGIIADPDAAKALVEQAHATRKAEADAAAARRAANSAAAQDETQEADGPAEADVAGERVDRRPLTLTRAVLYYHLSRESIEAILNGVPDAGAAVGRVEYIGPIIADQIKQWLGHSQVTVKPVIDLDTVKPVDCYEAPRRITEAVRLRHPADYFPYATCVSDRQDGDHVQHYLPMNRGGPPGQTGPDTLALATRRHHRIKTHGGWTVRALHPGAWLWRTPHGWYYLVDHQGTTALGRL